MHHPVKKRLEELLESTSDGEIPQELRLHVEACDECRTVLQQMRDQSRLLRVLRSEQALEPAPGFYARVLARIESRRETSIWALILEPAFGRPLLLASLAISLLLGGYMVTIESDHSLSPASPEIIMAVEPYSHGAQTLGTNPQRDRNTVLVTLATYR